MAVGKNKQKNIKKGGRKKLSDPFLKKEWYDIRAPTVFPVKSVGKTIATKTQGTRIARDTLMGRIIEVSLGDLKPETEEEAFRKFRLKVEDVNGFNCLTQFHGMDLTTDKLRSLVRKWQTLIEAHADVRTTDGYALRLFAIGFTRRHKEQVKKTAYATAAQVRTIRKKMKEVLAKEGSNCDLNALVEKLMIETIGKEIERVTQATYPLQHCLIRKVKMLRSPKIDVTKLLESHGGSEALSAATGALNVGPNVVTAGGTGATDTGVKVDAKSADAKSTDAKSADAKADAKKDAKGSDKPAAKDAKDKKGGDKKDGKAKGGDGKKGGDAKKDAKKGDGGKKKA